MQLFLNRKEVSALIKSLEAFAATNPQCTEAQKLLERIFVCLEKQGRSKTNR